MASLDTMSGLWSVREDDPIYTELNDCDKSEKCGRTFTSEYQDNIFLRQENICANYSSHDPNDTDSSNELHYRFLKPETLSAGKFDSKTKRNAYDSEDSGTVCGEDISGEDDYPDEDRTNSVQRQEGICNFSDRFGHLFIVDLPVPLPRIMSHFFYMSARNSKRRAPLPPLPRQMTRARSSSMLIDKRSVRSSYRKYINRKFSHAGKFPLSRLSLPCLPKVPGYFTQTAPGKLQSPPSKEVMTYALDEMSGTLGSTLFSSSMGSTASSFQSFSTFSSSSSSSSASNSSTGSYSKSLQGQEGTYRFQSSPSDFSSTGYSTSSWDRSSLSSLQHVETKACANVELQIPSTNKPTSVPHSNSCKVQQSTDLDKCETKDIPKHATILTSGIRGSVKPKQSCMLQLLCDGQNYDQSKLKKCRSSSEGCYLSGIENFIENTEDFSNKNNSSSKAHRLRKSIRNKSLRLKNKYGTKKMLSSGQKSFRNLLSTVSATKSCSENQEDIWIGADWKYMDSDSSDECERFHKDNLVKSKSDTTFNLMVDNVDFSTVVSKTPDCHQRKEEKPFNAAMREYIHFRTYNNAKPVCYVDKSSVTEDESHLKQTEITSFPSEKDSSESPIYENVTSAMQSNLMLISPLEQRNGVLPAKFVDQNNRVQELNVGSFNIEMKSEESNCNTSNIDKIYDENPHRSGESIEDVVAANKDHCDDELTFSTFIQSESSLTKQSNERCGLIKSSNIYYDKFNLSVRNNTFQKHSPTLEHLANERRRCGTSAFDNSCISQPASPVSLRKPVITTGGKVKDLIQRFSSMDNLSRMNNTLPNRSPKTKLLKQKIGIRNVMSHDSEHNHRYNDLTTRIYKYGTSDRNQSHELSTSNFCLENLDNADEVKSYKTVKSHFSTVISIPEDSHEPVECKNVMQTVGYDSSNFSKNTVALVKEEYKEDSPFTSMVKKSPILSSLNKSVSNEPVEEYSNGADGKAHQDQISRNEKSENLLLLLKTPSDLNIPNGKYKDTIQEKYLQNNTEDIHSIYWNDSNSLGFVDNEEEKKDTIVNIKKSPFQKFKASLLGVFQQSQRTRNPSTTISARRNTLETYNANESNSRLPDSHTIEDNKIETDSNCINSKGKKSTIKSYIQLKSLRTWKDSKKFTRLQEADDQITAVDYSNVKDTMQTDALSSRSSLPYITDFSSNQSSNTCSSRNSSPELSSEVSDVPSDQHLRNIEGVQSWKFNPICSNGEEIYISGDQTSIQDQDRSITYASHDLQGMYRNIRTNSTHANDRSVYSKVFRNSRKFLKSGSISLQPSYTTSSKVSNQRRYSLSNFFPEITTNDQSPKKLTPSSLYPITLSPTPISADEAKTQGQSLPTVHISVTMSPSLPLSSQQPRTCDPPTKFSCSPPYFCTQNVSNHGQRFAKMPSMDSIPPPLQSRFQQKRISFLHCVDSGQMRNVALSLKPL